MKGTARIAGLLSGAALAFGLILGAAPGAHADGRSGDGNRDGRDRASVDTSDWPQGKSLSNPDGGDMDKPGFSGGTIGDQDGNNGCGNDDDGEDDNNGDCEGESLAQPDQDEGCREDSDGADGEGAGTADDDFQCPAVEGTVAAASASADATATAAAAASAAAATAAGTASAATAESATEVASADTGTAATPAPGTEVLGIAETRPDTLSGRTGANVLALTGAAFGVLAVAGYCLGGGRLAGLGRRLLGS